MANTQGKQEKNHPHQPIFRKGSAHGVPSGSKGKSPEDSGPDKSVHGVPGGGRANNSAYAVPNAHKENASNQAGQFPSGNAMPGNTQQVNQQPRVPFDQLTAQPSNSGQSFPYGSAKGGFGFDRLGQG